MGQEQFKISDAKFSADRVYRYDLQRQWDFGKGHLAVIGLNPSTADEVKSDPTVTRCINYAKKWGCCGLVMLNIFAFRATDPKDMKAAADPVGPDNDYWLNYWCSRARITLAAWGTHGGYMGRGFDVMENLRGVADLKCLEITKLGYPKHPLYCRGDLIPRDYDQKSIDSAIRKAT